MQLEAKKSGYEQKAVSLAEYCRYLIEIAKARGLKPEECPTIARFVEVVRLEKEINFPQAELERNAFIKDLSRLLDENGVKELLAKSQEFKAKKITPQEYYFFLKARGEQKFDLQRDYPLLYSYITYVTLSRDVNAGDILKELNTTEDKIKEACFTNNEQKRLAEISKSIRILTKILNLELTP